MTAGTMVPGALPFARRASWWPPADRLVIVGGMSLGTLLTLFVIPAVYSYLRRNVVAGRNASTALPAPAK